jgi:hypothetical protein
MFECKRERGQQTVTLWLPAIGVARFCWEKVSRSVGSGPRGRRACRAEAAGEGGFKSFRPDQLSEWPASAGHFAVQGLPSERLDHMHYCAYTWP